MNEISFKYTSLKIMTDIANENHISFGKAVMIDQAKQLEKSEAEVIKEMKDRYDVMVSSVNEGLTKHPKLKIEQNDGASIYDKYVASGKSMLGEKLGKAVSRAMAVAEVNASMGKICASPTAGSCGIMPGSIITVKEVYNISEEKTLEGLFAAAGLGMVISNIVSLAGAAAGCQAECGAATAMAAAAIVIMRDGSNEQMMDAASIAIKNIEGLVCDPVASLVECPCIKRNANGAISAILSADMVLGGIKSIIPIDDVLASMSYVGRVMDVTLRETSLGGLATTDSAKKFKI